MSIASSPSAYDFQSVVVRGARRIELLKEKGPSSTFYGRGKITNDIKSRRVYYASVWKKIPRTKDISVYSKLSTCSPSTIFSNHPPVPKHLRWPTTFRPRRPRFFFFPAGLYFLGHRWNTDESLDPLCVRTLCPGSAYSVLVRR